MPSMKPQPRLLILLVSGLVLAASGLYLITVAGTRSQTDEPYNYETVSRDGQAELARFCKQFGRQPYHLDKKEGLDCEMFGSPMIDIQKEYAMVTYPLKSDPKFGIVISFTRNGTNISPNLPFAIFGKSQ